MKPIQLENIMSEESPAYYLKQSLLLEEELLNDYAVSDWLKKRIVETNNRDALDALRDSEILTKVLELRCMKLGLLNKKRNEGHVEKD